MGWGYHWVVLNPWISKLTILHTNDVHSHIDPFPADDPRNPNMGGVKSFTNWNDQEEDPNVLLLDAGDFFRGLLTLITMVENKLMSMMQYDASTIGNHDFDNGVEGLYANASCKVWILIGQWF
jgi:5'-nucleotidase